MQNAQKVLKLRNINGHDSFSAKSHTVSPGLIPRMWMLFNLVQTVPEDQIGQDQHWSGDPRSKIHLLPDISCTLLGAGAWLHWSLLQEWVSVLFTPPPWAPPSFWSCALPVDFSSTERWSDHKVQGQGSRGVGEEINVLEEGNGAIGHVEGSIVMVNDKVVLWSIWIFLCPEVWSLAPNPFL